MVEQGVRSNQEVYENIARVFEVFTEKLGDGSSSVFAIETDDCSGDPKRKVRCIYYGISRNQRVRELNEGWTSKLTKNYENAGCYDCNGLRTVCEFYQKPGQERLNKESADELARIILEKF
jgi:hypothetical protein